MPNWPPPPPLLSPFLLLIIHSDHIRSKFQTLKVNKHLQAYTEILSGNESIRGKIKFWGIFWQFLTPRLPKNSQTAMKLCKLLILKMMRRILNSRRYSIRFSYLGRSQNLYFFKVLFEKYQNLNIYGIYGYGIFFWHC